MITDWQSFFFGIASASVLSFIYFLYHDAKHKSAARFDMAMSKVYAVLEHYISVANQLRNNINTLSTEAIYNHDTALLDRQIYDAVIELENATLLTQMFFDAKDRECFNELVDAAQLFRCKISNALQCRDLNQISDIREKARTAFNKKYASEMRRMIDLMHDKALGEWQRDSLISKLKN